MGSFLLVVINLLCSGSFIYELYSDLIIVWISIFSYSQIVFGFFAVLFPLVNRVFQLYLCVKIFVLGSKMRHKTIPNTKLDPYIVSMNFYNMSRLIFPEMTSCSKKVLIFITVKECIFKLIQVALKLVAVT